jgi:hypothetical protein
VLIKVKMLSINNFACSTFPGDPSSDRRSHGAEVEPAAIQPTKHASRSPAAQQAFASEHPRVSLIEELSRKDSKVVKSVNQTRKHSKKTRRQGREILQRSEQK